MPLPSNPQTVWPPQHMLKVFDKYREWAAWYSGDPAYLVDFYGGQAVAQGQAPNQVQNVPWWKFWSRTGNQLYTNQQRAQMHVPLAGDLASVSAALLFGEEPRVAIPEAHEGENGNAQAKTLEERLKKILEDGGAYNRLIEAAETSAAMSGVFLKPAWDKELLPFPLLSVAQVDQAVPDFKWGILTAVTFYREVGNEGQQVFRHLERHEVVDGRAYILHGLYLGSQGMLGERKPLTMHEATRGLEEVMELPFDMLDVQYIPNMRPNRMWRNSALGMSDFAGAETLLDALDETYASWMRDIRLGKARIVVPDEYLTATQRFDIDHEVFTRLQMEPGAASQGTKSIEAHQFEIRYQEHLATSLELVERVVSNAGYSPQTYGIRIEGRAESGTALRIRENKTMLTMRRKGHWWRPALETLFLQMLLIDKEVFGTEIEVGDFRPSVDLSDSLSQGIEELAGTANILKQAQSASIEVRVRLVHPEWTDDQVKAEVEKIKEEEGVGAVMSPEMPGLTTPPAGTPEEGEQGEVEAGEEEQSA